ncbi:MAG: glycosyltransferase family 4 protein, partial [Candidatus Dadabacteria bacterium]
PGSARQMADAIVRLVTDKALRESMGKAGRERVRERFSAESVAANIQKVILGVSGGGQ